MDEMQHLMPLTWDEFKHYIFLAFSAGICEEVVFRGFIVTYISYYAMELPYGTWVAIIIPALVFSLSHMYQGWLAVLKIFIISMLFGGIFLVSGSLIVVILIHVFIDIISGLVGVFSSAAATDD